MNVLRSRRVVLPEGERPAAVCVSGGRIVAVEPYEFGGEDLGDLALLPGLVDTHVHVNEPGRTEWEGFATATRAAAAGGVTTIIDMPLNSIPPTVDVASLETKRQAAQGQCHVDVGFWGGAVPSNLDELASLQQAGVFGFKCFLLDSGVPEFPPLTAAELNAAVDGIEALFVVHAEDPSLVETAPSSRDYRDFLASRPRDAENKAIATVIETARRTGRHLHVLHLSSSDALEALAEAKRDGVPVTAETCPHYLTLTAEQVPDGATQYKCCPPIREADNRDALWRGLAAGTIDCVVSDHSPSTPALKRLDTGDGVGSAPSTAAPDTHPGDFAAALIDGVGSAPSTAAPDAHPGDFAAALIDGVGSAPSTAAPDAHPGVLSGDFAAAWGGIASLQLGLPVVWTEARRRGYSLADVVRWMARRPAELAGLRRKGRIAVGYDADFAAFAPDETFTVDPAALHHRHPVTPYAGQLLHGVVHQTWLRGEVVSGDPRGTLL